MGRLQKTGISQKTCHTRLIFKAFGKKSAGSFIDSHFKFLRYIEYRIDDLINIYAEKENYTKNFKAGNSQS
jgi:hypothetical protein